MCVSDSKQVCGLERRSDNIRSVVSAVCVRVQVCGWVVGRGLEKCEDYGDRGKGHSTAENTCVRTGTHACRTCTLQVVTGKGRFVVTASDDCTARVWDLSAAGHVPKQAEHEGRVKLVGACLFSFFSCYHPCNTRAT